MTEPRISRIEAPLSPHLQIYRPQLTSVLSIIHRATGIVLSLGALLLCGWLITLAVGGEIYGLAMALMRQWYGLALILGFVFSLYYHLLNGIRHLFWDLGAGLELATSYRSGYAVVIGSLALTALTVYLRLGP